MKTSDQLKQERKAKLDEMRSLLNLVDAEKRDMTEAEQTRFDALESEIEDLDAQVTRAEKREKAEKRLALDKAKNDGFDDEAREIKGNYSIVRHLRYAKEKRASEGFEREMEQEAQAEFQRSSASLQGGGILIPTKVLRSGAWGTTQKRDMTVEGSSGAEGGHNVQTDTVGYVSALRERSLLMNLGAGMMDGLEGNIKMPRENAVASFAWEGEVDAAAETSPTYTSIDLKPERLAGFVDVSAQLLNQTGGSIQRRIEDQINLGHALALDIAGWQGTGSSDQPTGIITDSDVVVHAIATNGGALTDAGILELEQKLADVFGAMNPVFVTTNKGRRKLKNTALDAGSGIFLWDRRENTVEGYPGYATTHLPSNLTKGSGTALSAAVLGSINEQTCTFGMWGGLEIIINPYTKAKSGIVEMVVNSYCDFAVLQPKAFVVVKDFDTSIS